MIEINMIFKFEILILLYGYFDFIKSKVHKFAYFIIFYSLQS